MQSKLLIGLILIFANINCVVHKKEKVPIRILKTSFYLDGGSKTISYFCEKGDFKTIVVTAYGKKEKDEIFLAARLGTVFLNGHPDDEGSQLASAVQVAEILEDLTLWYNMNVVRYGISDIRDHIRQIDEMSLEIDIQKTSYIYMLHEAIEVKETLDLIKKGLQLKQKYKDEEILKAQKRIWPNIF